MSRDLRGRTFAQLGQHYPAIVRLGAIAQENRMRLLLVAGALAAMAAGSLSMTSQAQAVGCISGAVAGGVAGHYAGHHAVLGAIGGCAVGHHLAVQAKQKKKLEEEQKQEQMQQPAPGQTGTVAH
jgi:hypothetical protein